MDILIYSYKFKSNVIYKKDISIAIFNIDFNIHVHRKKKII